MSYVSISESYLHSIVPLDDNSFSLNGYSLTCADHPHDVKRGVACMYYKENLSLRSALLISINVYYVKWLVQKAYIAVIYLSPSQSCNEFEDFLFNIEKFKNQIKQSKPSFTIILGDFNARSSDWWADDTTSPEDTHINSLISMYCFEKLL